MKKLRNSLYFWIGFASVLVLWAILHGCSLGSSASNDPGGTTLCPTSDVLGACGHEAVYCALVLGQVIPDIGGEPYIEVGQTLPPSPFSHSVCRTQDGRYARMGWYGVILEDGPLYPFDPEFPVQKYTVREFIQVYFGWVYWEVNK